MKKNFIATTNNNQQQNDDKRNNKKRNLNDQNALSVSSPKKFKSNLFCFYLKFRMFKRFIALNDGHRVYTPNIPYLKVRMRNQESLQV